MDLEIQDELEKRYKNLYIEVEYKDIKKYQVKIRIEKSGIEYESLIEYNYNAYYTIKANCDKIEEIIDNIILTFYKKG